MQATDGCASFFVFETDEVSFDNHSSKSKRSDKTSMVVLVGPPYLKTGSLPKKVTKTMNDMKNMTTSSVFSVTAILTAGGPSAVRLQVAMLVSFRPAECAQSPKLPKKGSAVTIS
jgi:hypothetical protein